MSVAGTENPAFASGDECASQGAKAENGGQQQQVSLDPDRGSTTETDGAPTENGHQPQSYVSQHYVEPIKSHAEPCYKTETKIELPDDDTEKSAPEPKLNGVHGNGNNNDASFLNNSATSVQMNESGKKEQIEAVNLELVSMRPYTGNNIQTKGQEACEVPTDPYEEYFVPVNEHRKYIRGPEAEVETTVAGVRFDLGPGVGREGLSLRDPAAGLVDYSHWLTALRGEKLYVTKDKRSRNSYWRRMAWGCGLLVLLIAIIIAILAATGVILTQEATEPLENVEESNTRQLGDVLTAGRQGYVKNPPSSPPPSTSSFPPWPTTDETLYPTVPDTLDGKLRLYDFDWSRDLNDTKSERYRQMVDDIEKQLKEIFHWIPLMSGTLIRPAFKVYELNEKGEVKFRIHPSSSIHLPREFQEGNERTLWSTDDMIGRFNLSEVQIGQLIDRCELGDLKCAGSCKYDYSDGVFLCTCSSGKILHQDGRSCVDDNDLSNVEMEDVAPESNTETIQDVVQGRSRGPGTEQFDRHPDTWKNPDLKIESDETNTPTSIKSVHPQFERGSSTEQQSASTPRTKHVHAFTDDERSYWDHDYSHHSVETNAEPQPPVNVPPTAEPTFAVPTIEPEPVSEPEQPASEPESAAEPESVAKPEPAAESEPTFEPTATVEPEPAVESKSVAAPEPTAEAEPTSEPASAAEPEPAANPEPAVESEPAVEPEPAIEPESTVEPKPTATSIPDAEIRPTSEPESVMETVSAGKSESASGLDLVDKLESTAEPESIGKSEATAKTETYSEVPVTEPIAIMDEINVRTNKDEQTESPRAITTQSNVETSNQPAFTAKPMPSEDTNMTDGPKSPEDLTNENDRENEPSIVEADKGPAANDDVLLQVIPLTTSKTTSVNINDVETKTEPTTMQSYTTSKEDEINRSITNVDFTTLPYGDSVQDDNENVMSSAPRNREESDVNAKQLAQSPAFQEDKAIGSTTTEASLDASVNNNVQNGRSSERSNNSVTTAPVTSAEDESTLDDRHVHTTEVNGASGRDAETYDNPEINAATMIPETTSADATPIRPVSERNERPVSQIESDLQDTNDKNVIEHMPTTVFPKVPKNFAHNVEPLVEPAVARTPDDEHIMLISKSEQPVEIHAIIPQLTPEQSVQNRSAENSTAGTNDGPAIDENSNAEKAAGNTTATTATSAVRPDENIVHVGSNEYTVRPDDAQEHSTNHPLHPAIFPENTVDHSAGKFDAGDRHVEDMSPFLPDVHREKESAKKAPRLDKDEQDVPNPFDTHVDDVITHRPLVHSGVGYGANETETKDLLNDVNSHPTGEASGKSTDDRRANTPNGANGNANDTDTDVRNISHRDGSLVRSDDGRFPYSHNVDLTEGTIGVRGDNSSEENNETLRVIPLAVEDKPLDTISQITTQFADRESAEVTTIPTQVKMSREEDVADSVAGSGATSPEKPEENAVEDQYNDITDETLLKEYRHGTTGKDDPIRIAGQQAKEAAVLNDVDSTVIPYKNTSSSTTAPDTVLERKETERGTPSDSTQAPMTTMDGSLDNKTNDGRLTTQEPVLPMEIQQEMSTTVASDKVQVTTMIVDNGKPDEINTESPNVGRSDDEKETTVTAAHLTTTQSTLETKTTAQIPILPEELQTTESDALTTTPMTPMSEEKEAIATKDVNGETKENEANEKEEEDAVTQDVAKDVNGTSSEKTMAATTIYRNNMNADEDASERSGTTTENSTESAKGETIFMTTTERSTASSVERTTPNDIVTTTEDVRPVTEVLLDDTRPMIEFDYRTLFPTTPRRPLIQPDEPSEEQLRVIPLEKSQENKKKSADKKGFDKFKYKKEKDLSAESQNGEENASTESIDPITLLQTGQSNTESYEELSDSAVSGDLDPSVSRFVLADTRGNILPISKLSGAQNGSNSTENRGTIAVTKPKNYPSFIPVSEEIIEPIPVTQPFVLMRNFTYRHPLSGFGAESANGGTTATIEPEVYRAIDANETAERSVTDRSFAVGDKEERVDRVTEESVVTRAENATSRTSESGAIGFSRCTAGQFQCVNGISRDGAYCVNLSAKCDSETDCSDGSDELNCVEEGCPGNFRCANGQCLKKNLVCNRIVDCHDGSDERNCEDWKCQFDEFRCPNGRCIPALWRCDGRPDCDGHQDEYNCAESCDNNEYLCPTEKWCIPQTWRCNGIPECVDGEDEKLCDCALEQFKCKTGGCIPLLQVCDGIENCPDHSDEWECLTGNITASKNLTGTETDGDEASGLPTDVSLLKIRQHNGDYRLVCSDGWSEEFSDSYCRALGFAGAETTELSARDRGQKILRLKANPNHRRPLVTNLEQVEFCVSDKVVKVSCQKFSCGLHSTEGPTARLADGTPASNGLWSSIALLKEIKHGTACTASILGPMHVLTSYSCIYRYKEMRGWELFVGGDILKGYFVKNIMPYPQVKYNQFLYNNDIVLMELEEPLVFSRSISAVCLPKQPIQPSQICVTAGWEFPINGEVDLQRYLKFLPVPTYDSEMCNATDHYAGFITRYDICVEFTDPDKGSCFNDEGAPLMCASESQGVSERWEIQGLLSHHSRCSRDHPAIYSSLEPALSWLHDSVPALQTQS